MQKAMAIPRGCFVFLCVCGLALAGCQSRERVTAPDLPVADRGEAGSPASEDKPIVTYYVVYRTEPMISLRVYAKSDRSYVQAEEVSGLTFVSPITEKPRTWLEVDCLQASEIEVDEDEISPGQPLKTKAIIHRTRPISEREFTMLYEWTLSGNTGKEIADNHLTKVLIGVKLLGESSSRSIELPLDGTPRRY